MKAGDVSLGIVAELLARPIEMVLFRRSWKQSGSLRRCVGAARPLLSHSQGGDERQGVAPCMITAHSVGRALLIRWRYDSVIPYVAI